MLVQLSMLVEYGRIMRVVYKEPKLHIREESKKGFDYEAVD